MDDKPFVDGKEQAIFTHTRKLERDAFVGVFGQINQHRELLALAGADGRKVHVPGRKLDHTARRGVERGHLGGIVSDLVAENDVLHMAHQEHRISQADIDFAAFVIFQPGHTDILAIAPAHLHRHTAINLVHHGGIERTRCFEGGY